MKRNAENLRQMFGEFLNRLTEGKAHGQAAHHGEQISKQYQHTN